MREVAIVTDSTADLTPELCEANGIGVVNLGFSIDDRTYIDGELSQEEFFALMRASSELPKTSQPPVGAFVEMYRRQLEKAKNVVSVHISHNLSGTIESAREAARQFGERVHVVDTLNLSWGEGWQVLEAARAAERGAGWQEVVSAVEGLRDRVQMIVGLDSLENLAKGGRIGKVSALLGSMLNLRVMITVNEEGSFEPVARSRGAKAALEETMKWVSEKMGDHKRGRFAIMHAMAPDRAEWLKERITSVYEAVEVHVIKAGPVITSHTGTGWGVALVPLEVHES